MAFPVVFYKRELKISALFMLPHKIVQTGAAASRIIRAPARTDGRVEEKNHSTINL
jgi:hypothetical protein